jgi:hypothetical protein
VQFVRYKEMQRLLELEHAAWDDQHKTIGRRGNPVAASFTLGSMFGGVANAIRSVGTSAQPSLSGQDDRTSGNGQQQRQQQEEQDLPVMAEEEAVWTNTAPHPVRSLRLLRCPDACLWSMSRNCCVESVGTEKEDGSCCVCRLQCFEGMTKCTEQAATQ